MMLSTALKMVIDNTECLFLLNTDNSINTKELIEYTQSAWIYSEVTMSNLIRRKELSDFRPKKTKYFSDDLKKAKNESFEYKLDTRHLTRLNNHNIASWIKEYSDTPERCPLDSLYKQFHEKDIIFG